MYVFGPFHGRTRRLGSFGAAAQSTRLALSPVLSHQTTKQSIVAVSSNSEHRRRPGARRSISLAQPPGVRESPPAKPSTGAGFAPIPGAAKPSSPYRSTSRELAKCRRTSPGNQAEDVVDLPLWLRDAAPDTSPTSSSRLLASGGTPGPSLLSGSGPPAGVPLSPATARALARGFRAGDLALASAGPLQVIAGGGAATTAAAAISSNSGDNHVAEGARGGGGGGGDDVDVVLLGPPGRPRDLSVLVAAVELLAHRPRGRGRVGCVVVSHSRERVEVLQEAAFTLLSERGGGPEAMMHVMAVHGGTRLSEDVSGLRSQAPDLLLATPGRLLKLLDSDQVRLDHLFESLRVLVFDGGEVLSLREFRPQVERLLRLLPNAALYTMPPRRGPPPRIRSAVPAAAAAAARPGPQRVITLVAAAAPPPPLLLQSTTTMMGARGDGSDAAADPAAAAAVPFRLLRAADQPLAVQKRPTLREPLRPLGSVGAVGVQHCKTPPQGAAPAAAPSPQADLKRLTDLALRKGFVAFKLQVNGGGSGGDNAGNSSNNNNSGGDGHSYGAFGGGSGNGSGSIYGGVSGTTLAAAIQVALGGTPRGAAEVVGSAASEPSAPGVGRVTHGSVPQDDKLNADGSVRVTGEAPAAAAAADPVGGGTESSSVQSSVQSIVRSPAPSMASLPTASSPPLVPLHVLAVPYEEHLPYLYVVVRQHMLSEGRHKIVVQFPTTQLADLYARLFQALGFPAACAHGRVRRASNRQEAVRDFSAALRGLLFCTDLAGLDVAGCELTMVVWVGLPRHPGQLVQYMAAVQQAATAAPAAVAAMSRVTAMDTGGVDNGGGGGGAHGAAQEERIPKHVIGGDDIQGVHPIDAVTAAAAAATHPISVPVAAVATATAAAATALVRKDGSSGAAAAEAAAVGEAVGAAAGSPPRCLLVLNDVEAPRRMVAAAAAALASAGLGRVVPLQPDAVSGPLDDISRRIHQALIRVPPKLKLKGLEGLMGHMWATRTYTSAAVAAAAAAAAAVTAKPPPGGSSSGDGGGSPAAGSGGANWAALGAGLGSQPEHQLGTWARRFAAAMGMPQPPLLSRHVIAKMGLQSIPGVTLVDFHAGRQPPPGIVLPQPLALQVQAPPPGLRFACRLQLERQRRREREIQMILLQDERRRVKVMQQGEKEQQQREEGKEQQKRLRKDHKPKQQREQQQQQGQGQPPRPKLHPPSVIGRYRLFRALKRAQKMALQDTPQAPAQS